MTYPNFDYTSPDTPSTPESSEDASSGEYVKQSGFVTMCMLGLAILLH